MPAVKLDEAEFKRRFRAQNTDPAFNQQQTELERIADAAWGGQAIQEEVRNVARTLLTPGLSPGTVQRK